MTVDLGPYVRGATKAARWVGVGVVIVVVAFLLPVIYSGLHSWMSGMGALPRQDEVYALNTVVPTSRCKPVTSEDILNGTVNNGEIELRHILASLRYHVRESGKRNRDPIQGICARYLDRHGVCACLVNMVRNPKDPENWMIMYNMKIVGYSRYNIVENTEKSILCANTVEARRFKEITVEWLNEEGVLRERDVRGMAAQSIQQLDVVQRGRGSCQDSNVEAQMAILRELIEEINAGQMMLNHQQQQQLGIAAGGGGGNANKLGDGRAHTILRAD